jgi:hypothetical protein
MGDIARKTLRDGGEKKSVSDSDEAGSFVEINKSDWLIQCFSLSIFVIVAVL